MNSQQLFNEMCATMMDEQWLVQDEIDAMPEEPVHPAYPTLFDIEAEEYEDDIADREYWSYGGW